MTLFFPVLKYRLLEGIYREPGINVSELLKKGSIPPRAGSACLRDFLKAAVLKEEPIGKKPTLRKFYPNLESETGRLAFSLLEAEKSSKFFMEHPSLVGPFEHFRREVAQLSGRNKVRTAAIFGSYARGGETTHESDIDMLIVVSTDDKKGGKRLLERICAICFVTVVEARVSARTISESQFKKLKEIEYAEPNYRMKALE